MFCHNYPKGIILKVEKSYKINLQNKVKLNKKYKISGEEFFKKILEKYIKNGEIHNMKQGIENFLNNKRNTDDYYDKDEFNLFENATNDMICKLKIQVEILNKILTLNILNTDKFSTLFDFLKKKS